ncbi:MAG: metal-sulfur cluster assembly factor [Thermodesulfobacteriota bacterium]
MSETEIKKVTEDSVIEILSDIYDPEIPIDIVNLGLVYKIDIEGSKVNIDMTMTSPGCPASGQIVSEAKYLVEELEGVDEVNIEIVWDPPWDPGKMSEAAKESLGMF